MLSIDSQTMDSTDKYLHKKFKKQLSVDSRLHHDAPKPSDLAPAKTTDSSDDSETSKSGMAGNSNEQGDLEISSSTTVTLDKTNGKYMCPYCNLACSKPSVLQKHIRAHTNERPYPCDSCGFSFKTRSNLYKHRRSRTHANRVMGNKATENQCAKSPDLAPQEVLEESPSTNQSKPYKPRFHTSKVEVKENTTGKNSNIFASQDLLSSHINDLISKNNSIVNSGDFLVKKPFETFFESQPANDQESHSYSSFVDEPLNLTAKNRKRCMSEVSEPIVQKSLIKELLLKNLYADSNMQCPHCKMIFQTVTELELHKLRCKGNNKTGAKYTRSSSVNVASILTQNKNAFDNIPQISNAVFQLKSPGPFLGKTRLVENDKTKSFSFEDALQTSHFDQNIEKPTKNIVATSEKHLQENLLKKTPVKLFGGEVKIAQTKNPMKDFQIDHTDEIEQQNIENSNSKSENCVILKGMHTGGTVMQGTSIVFEPQSAPPILNIDRTRDQFVFQKIDAKDSYTSITEYSKKAVKQFAPDLKQLRINYNIKPHKDDVNQLQHIYVDDLKNGSNELNLHINNRKIHEDLPNTKFSSHFSPRNDDELLANKQLNSMTLQDIKNKFKYMRMCKLTSQNQQKEEFLSDEMKIDAIQNQSHVLSKNQKVDEEFSKVFDVKNAVIVNIADKERLDKFEYRKEKLIECGNDEIPYNNNTVSSKGLLLEKNYAGLGNFIVYGCPNKEEAVGVLSDNPRIPSQMENPRVTNRLDSSKSSNQMDSPRVTSRLDSPRTSNEMDISGVSSHLDSPRVLNQVDNSRFSNEMESTRVTISQLDSSRVLTQSERYRVSSQTDSPRVLTQSENYRVSNQLENPRASNQGDITRVTSLLNSPRATSQVDYSRVTNQLHSTRVTSQLDNPRVTSQLDNSRVSSQLQSPRITSQLDSPRVLTPSDSYRVLNHLQSHRVLGRLDSPRVISQVESPRVISQVESPRVISQVESPRVLSQLESPRVLSQPCVNPVNLVVNGKVVRHVPGIPGPVIPVVEDDLKSSGPIISVNRPYPAILASGNHKIYHENDRESKLVEYCNLLKKQDSGSEVYEDKNDREMTINNENKSMNDKYNAEKRSSIFVSILDSPTSYANSLKRLPRILENTINQNLSKKLSPNYENASIINAANPLNSFKQNISLSSSVSPNKTQKNNQNCLNLSPRQVLKGEKLTLFGNNTVSTNIIAVNKMRPNIKITPPELLSPSASIYVKIPDILTPDGPMESPREPEKKKFARPNSLALLPSLSHIKQHHGLTPTMFNQILISPETPRVAKKYMQHYLHGNYFSYLGLKTSTKSVYCTLNKTQPFYVPHFKKLSMYSEWRQQDIKFDKQYVSAYDSRQKQSKFSVSGRCLEYLVVHSSYKFEAPEDSSKSDGKSNLLGGYESNEEYTYIRGRGRGRYVCDQCGIRCKKPSMLKKHIRTHSNVRPYTCSHCNFSFKTKGNLTKHMKSKAHTRNYSENKSSGSSTVQSLASSDSDTDDSGMDSSDESTRQHEAAYGLLSLSQKSQNLPSPSNAGPPTNKNEIKDFTPSTYMDSEQIAHVNKRNYAKNKILDERGIKGIISSHNIEDITENMDESDENEEINKFLGKTNGHRSILTYPYTNKTSAITVKCDVPSPNYPLQSPKSNENQNRVNNGLLMSARQMLSPSEKSYVPKNQASWEQMNSRTVNLTQTTTANMSNTSTTSIYLPNVSNTAKTLAKSPIGAIETSDLPIQVPNSPYQVSYRVQDYANDPIRDFEVVKKYDVYKTVNFAYKEPYAGRKRALSYEDDSRSAKAARVEELHEESEVMDLSVQNRVEDAPYDLSAVRNSRNVIVENNFTVRKVDVPAAEESEVNVVTFDVSEPSPVLSVSMPQNYDNSAMETLADVATKQVKIEKNALAKNVASEFLKLTKNVYNSKEGVREHGPKEVNDLMVKSEENKSCTICSKNFNKPSQLRLHMNIHYLERPFRCDSCSVSFRTKGHLQKHERSASHHNKLSSSPILSSSEPRPFKCSDCNIAFRIHGHLAKHLRSKMHIMKLECLAKIPFGLYAELERSNSLLTEINTTDGDQCLQSLKMLAKKVFVNEPSKLTQLEAPQGTESDS